MKIMNYRTFIASLLLISSVVGAQQPSLNCNIGPVNKIYGKAAWYVYGCDDKHSVVVITAPGSAAAPFYFMFAYKEGAYKLIGEGTGNKAITDAAYKELSALKEPAIVSLYKAASDGVAK